MKIWNTGTYLLFATFFLLLKDITKMIWVNETYFIDNDLSSNVTEKLERKFLCVSIIKQKLFSYAAYCSCIRVINVLNKD